ncbi:UNVERIFIED_CONTAM: hypothetical protein HDU68_001167 [Siphonaria sp. JEL0065]|nr:hypothetical protein HDU68_001167 [Siphonaria sp. JEL0065]
MATVTEPNVPLQKKPVSFQNLAIGYVRVLAIHVDIKRYFQLFSDAAVGFCIFMKTVEVTRHRDGPQKSTIEAALEIFRREGIVGINKACGRMSILGSRFGLSRVAGDLIRGKDKSRKLIQFTW